MLTITPAPRGAIERAAARVPKNVPSRWTASIVRHSASGCSSARSTDALSLTSAATATPSTSCAVNFAASRFTSSTATFAPSRASRMQIASPRPEPPPVTIATLRSTPTSGDEVERMQCALQRREESVDLGLADLRADQEVPERHLVVALVHQREVEVDDLLAIALHSRAVVDDALGRPVHTEQVAEARRVQRDVVTAAELVDAIPRAVADRLHARVHLRREQLERRDPRRERDLVAAEGRDRRDGCLAAVQLRVEQ